MRGTGLGAAFWRPPSSGGSAVRRLSHLCKAARNAPLKLRDVGRRGWEPTHHRRHGEDRCACDRKRHGLFDWKIRGRVDPQRQRDRGGLDDGALPRGLGCRARLQGGQSGGGPGNLQRPLTVDCGRSLLRELTGREPLLDLCADGSTVGVRVTDRATEDGKARAGRYRPPVVVRVAHLDTLWCAVCLVPLVEDEGTARVEDLGAELCAVRPLLEHLSRRCLTAARGRLGELHVLGRGGGERGPDTRTERLVGAEPRRRADQVRGDDEGGHNGRNAHRRPDDNPPPTARTSKTGLTGEARRVDLLRLILSPRFGKDPIEECRCGDAVGGHVVFGPSRTRPPHLEKYRIQQRVLSHRLPPCTRSGTSHGSSVKKSPNVACALSTPDALRFAVERGVNAYELRRRYTRAPSPPDPD